MDPQNLAYALTQVVHNFGAVAVVGGTILGSWPQPAAPRGQRRLAWVILAGWLLQAASGLGFGAISFAYYGQFPDLHGIARAALFLKMGCATGGIVVTAMLLRQQQWSSGLRERAWTLLILLGIVALTAAAFLRWFS